MALQKNEFNAATRTLLDTLVDLKFIGDATDSQLRKIESSVKASVEEYRQKLASEGKAASNIMGISSRLLIPDLFRTTRSRRVPYGDESKHDDELVALIKEINGRSQAQCLCMVYEAFERFLKAFAPPLFYQMRKTWKLLHQKKFHTANKDIAKVDNRNTPQYFAAYVSHIARNNCDDLVKELKRLLPEFKRTASSNWYSNLFSYYRLLACIRHTTVHCNGEINRQSQSYRNLQKNEPGDLKSMTWDSNVTGKDTILPLVTDAERFINAISAFALLIYHIASKECKMKTMDFHANAKSAKSV